LASRTKRARPCGANLLHLSRLARQVLDQAGLRERARRRPRPGADRRPGARARPLCQPADFRRVLPGLASRPQALSRDGDLARLRDPRPQAAGPPLRRDAPDGHHHLRGARLAARAARGRAPIHKVGASRHQGNTLPQYRWLRGRRRAAPSRLGRDLLRRQPTTGFGAWAARARRRMPPTPRSTSEALSAVGRIASPDAWPRQAPYERPRPLLVAAPGCAA
jgi:hypothetical protein